jgi:hypothetical protein
MECGHDSVLWSGWGKRETGTLRTAIGAIVIAASLSACNSSGLPSLGPTQRFAYPVERVALPAVQDASASQPTLPPASPPAPTARAAALAPIEGQHALLPRSDAELPVYDDSKDPYVTAVLHPTTEPDDFGKDAIGADGKRSLPPPAKLEIINVSDGMKALSSETP